jgi:hydrogenase maturation protease
MVESLCRSSASMEIFGDTEVAVASSVGLLVLGLGNVLCGDDGAGPAVVGRLAAGWDTPIGARVADGGTLGLSLLALLSDCDSVILVDAVRVPGLAPGTIVRLTGKEVPAAARDQLSVHQVGVADLLEALHLLGRTPRKLVLFGVVPESVELAYGCTPAVVESLDELALAVVTEAAAQGFNFRPRRDANAQSPYVRVAAHAGVV